MAEEQQTTTLDDYDFSASSSGASATFPMEAGQIRKGGHIVIGDRPCKVVNVSTSKTGKHGHAKANFTAIDIFTGRKIEDVVPTSHSVMVPNVARKEYSLLDITDDGFLNLMDEGGNTKDDLTLPTYPEELAAEIRAAVDAGKNVMVTVLGAMDHEQVVSFKEENA
jgi:translation initiation factor 5A